jgi:hypothetical protein
MHNKSTEEIVALCIMKRFPNATLNTSVDGDSKEFQIFQNGNAIVTTDSIGAKFFFPNRIKGSGMKWSGVLEGGPEQVADAILRYMADAGFQVLSKNGDLMQKSPIRIDRFTFCPKCSAKGEIREILYGLPSGDYNKAKFVLGGCDISHENPEIKCVGCGWLGTKEEVRFAKRKSD